MSETKEIKELVVRVMREGRMSHSIIQEVDMPIISIRQTDPSPEYAFHEELKKLIWKRMNEFNYYHRDLMLWYQAWIGEI